MIKKFCEASGVSGCEKDIRNLIIEETENCGATFEIDPMGNLIAFKSAKGNQKNAKTIALSAHMDEVGLIITKINADGSLCFDAVGGIDTSVLLSKKVKIGNLNGVIGTKAVHLTDIEERNKKPEIESLYIDIGAKDEADAKKYVMPGDYAVFQSEYKQLGKNFAKAKAFDDRLGCITLIEALKNDYNVNLYCFFLTQEETGLRGAKAAFFEKNIDYAIVVESTTAGDITGTSPHMKVTEAGGGAAISVMDSASVANCEMKNLLCNVAETGGIKYQFKMAATGGNDGGAIHKSNGGIKTCSVSVPARYIHSPSSVVSLDDFENVKKLVIGFLKSFEREEFGNV